MTILILILMIYSIFGIHLTWTLGELKNGKKVTFSTNTICIFIAIILYCIKFFQTPRGLSGRPAGNMHKKSVVILCILYIDFYGEI